MSRMSHEKSWRTRSRLREEQVQKPGAKSYTRWRDPQKPLWQVTGEPGDEDGEAGRVRPGTAGPGFYPKGTGNSWKALDVYFYE